MPVSGRDGVVSTGIEGVAAAYAPESEPEPAEEAVGLDGLVGVVGTGWVKAAGGAEERGDGGLVETNGGEGEVFQFEDGERRGASRTRRQCRSKTEKGSSAAAGRPMATMSRGAGAAWILALKAARRRRRMRLRRTALPVRVVTEMPRRDSGVAAGERKASMDLRLSLSRAARTRAKSARRRNRPSFVTNPPEENRRGTGAVGALFRRRGGCGPSAGAVG